METMSVKLNAKKKVSSTQHKRNVYRAVSVRERETRLKGRVASLDGHCIFLTFSELGDRRSPTREKVGEKQNKKMSKLEEIIRRVLGRLRC